MSRRFGVFNCTFLQNTATGSFALLFNTTRQRQHGRCYCAFFSNTTANNNTAIGYFALYFNTTGNNNMANGYDALLNNTTGNENIALGNLAGSKSYRWRQQYRYREPG